MMNAYTVKKVLPRLLIAVIAINLSYYLMVIAIDITNIIGDGVAGLLLTPFDGANSFDPGGGASLVISVVAALGAISLFRNFTRSSTGNTRERVGSVVGYLMLSVVLPAILIILAILAVLSIRMALMILLAIGSPIAFVAMVLPNTEGIFKKWGSLFTTTLMIYPIVMAMFAMGKVMTIIFGYNAGGTSNGAPAETVSGILAIFAQFIPLALIPFAFKLAGGTIGAIGNFVTGKAGGLKTMIQGDTRDAGSRISRTRDRYRSKKDDDRVGRAEAAHDRAERFRNNASRRRVRGGALNRAASLGLGARARFTTVGYGGLPDVEAGRSALNKREREARELHTGFGRDNTRRGSTARLDLLGNERFKGTQWKYVDENGDDTDENTGMYKLKTLGGAWVSEADAVAGHQRYGGNQAAMQQNIEYEMSKASTGEDFEHLNNNIASTLQAQGFTLRGARDMLKGSGYSQQARVLQYKHGGLEEDGNGNFVFKKNTGKVLDDMYYNKPSYSSQQFNASTIHDLAELAESGDATDEQWNRLRDVHANLMSQSISEEGEGREPREGIGGNSGTAATAAAIRRLGNIVNPGGTRTAAGTPAPTPAAPPPEQAPRIIRPGDDNFKIPPGSRQ